MNRQSVLAMLQEDLRNAEKHLQDTSDYLDLAIQMNRSPGPTPDTQLRVRLAARAYLRAVDDRGTVLSRLECVMSDDTLVEGLKPVGSRKAQSARFNSRVEPN
jgi:hypothetical protein